MKLYPSGTLTEQETQTGLRYIIKDGLCTEAMVTLTGGTFLVAIALKLGASNFQIGLLAALPTLANIFQLLSIWLVQRYNNRRTICVICTFSARFPLFIIAALPFLFSGRTSVATLILLLSFHYFFSSVSGASWNSWMKDLVPEKSLGSYFSRRTRLTQTLNVFLSLLIAFILDHIKTYFPQYEIVSYSVMFLVGGMMGMAGAYMLFRTPEPQSHLPVQNLFLLMKKPLMDTNFRRLLVFNSTWSFALNMATPFFSVYLMKTLGLELPTIIILNILSQVSSILFVRLWGRYSDLFSNKTIISLCGPVYAACILAWSFASNEMLTMPLLVGIHIFSGIALSGINLSLSNIAIKLSPKNDAMVYLAAKNMTIAFIPALAPVLGGIMADFFAAHQFTWNISWEGPEKSSVFTLLHLSGWSFFFVIGSLLALFSVHFIRSVKEEGESTKNAVVAEITAAMKWKLKTSLRKPYFPAWFTKPAFHILSRKTKNAGSK